MSVQYVVCNRLLDPETNEHCEFDGRVDVDARGQWRCPGCRCIRYAASQDVSESHDSEPITAETPPVSPPTVIEGDRSGVRHLRTVARPLDLDSIEKRASRATPGPWEANFLNSWGVRTPDRYSIVTVHQGYPVASIDDEPGDHGADAWFIANAREDVPALVAAIRAALALHPNVNVPTSGSTDPNHVPTSRSLCGLCRDPWPCSTVKALL